MIGIFAFQAARRVIIGPDALAPRPRLYPRPRDCIGRGLSNKQIARATLVGGSDGEHVRIDDGPATLRLDVVEGSLLNGPVPLVHDLGGR